MNDASQILTTLSTYLQQIMRSGVPREPLQLDLSDVDADLAAICQPVNQFLLQIHESFQLGATMAEGELNVTLPRTNPLLMPLKVMQSNLNHLKWQVGQVAAGDLSQQVRFLGDFSACFNNMIESLKHKREIEQRLNIITSVLGEGVCLIDISGSLSYINPEGEKLLERSSADLIGQPIISIFKSVASAPAQDPVLNQLESALEQGVDFHSRDMVVVHHSGEELSVALEFRPVWQDDIYTGAVVAFHDISAPKYYEEQLRNMNQQLEKQATTDSLTGIYNRLKIDNLLAGELKRALRYDTQLAIAIVDIDHFKGVNDLFGHLAGDEVLKDFSELLLNSLRSSDYLGRWGGEEFLIILPQLNGSKAYKVMEKLRKLVENYNFSVERTITSSFGVAEFVSSDTPESLIGRADRALYSAKESGRNFVHLDVAS
ncbi:MAG: diguanylate cyclase [Desulfuromonas sp.]|nr:diguanylate cyclase [Desulfuromonas sp.]